MKEQFLRRSGLFLLVLGLAACSDDSPSDPGGGDPTPATFTQIQNQIFTPGCTNLGCHAPSPGPMSLEVGNAYAALVDQPSAYGMDRVEPGQPENSALYLKVIGDASVGSLMPLGELPLSDDKIEMIRSWIAAGAPND